MSSICILTFSFILSYCSSQCVIHNLLPHEIYLHHTAYDIISNCVYLFGGQTEQFTSIDTIYKRNMDQTNWTTLSIPTPTVSFYSRTQNSVIIDRIVYFVGIRDSSSKESGKIYKFDIETEDWISNDQLTPPTHPSVYGCLTQNETHLFMIGGSSNTGYDEYLQIYDINDNSWIEEAINVTPIKGNGWIGQYCHVVDNQLYAFGGSIHANRIDTIFKYNPLDKWSLLPSKLPIAASYGTIVYKQPYIYLIGGRNAETSSSLNTIIEFDVETESITDYYAMQERLEYIDAEIIDDKVYIFGGYNSGKDLVSKNIEQCDVLKSNAPSHHPSNAPSRRPSKEPSKEPSNKPSKEPSNEPSNKPSKEPSNEPSNKPSAIPSTLDTTTANTTTSDPTATLTTLVSETETEKDNDNEMDLLLYIKIAVVAILFVFCFCVVYMVRYCKRVEMAQDSEAKVAEMVIERGTNDLESKPNDKQTHDTTTPGLMNGNEHEQMENDDQLDSTSSSSHESMYVGGPGLVTAGGDLEDEDVDDLESKSMGEGQEPKGPNPVSTKGATNSHPVINVQLMMKGSVKVTKRDGDVNDTIK
eukprot:620032_1